MANGLTRAQLNAVNNYTFGEHELQSTSRIVNRPGVRKVSARRTWTEKTGYSFQEVYQGHHSDISRAFDNPNIVCGANSVVADRDFGSESATMAVSFGHRTKAEARANYAQPEEYKDFWAFEPQLIRLPIWRHPSYANVLDSFPYASGVVYPLARQIWIATNRFIQAWEERYNSEVTEDIVNIPYPDDALGILLLNRPFSIWELVEPPTFGTPAELAIKRNLGQDMAIKIMLGQTHFKEYRYILKNTTVVPSNSGVSPALIHDKRLFTSGNLAYVIGRNVWGLNILRSRTPALCRPISAPRLALIRNLRSGRLAGSSWRPFPGKTTEINNGSIEIVRYWEEQFGFEIDTNITPYITPAELRGY